MVLHGLTLLWSVSMIDFVSYDGRYPHLCSGVLVVRIQGITYAFCSVTERDPTGFRIFWNTRRCIRDMDSIVKVYGVDFISGGTCDWDAMNAVPGKWTVDLDKAYRADGKPFLLRGMASGISEVMSERVEWGCCGGCF